MRAGSYSKRAASSLSAKTGASHHLAIEVAIRLAGGHIITDEVHPGLMGRRHQDKASVVTGPWEKKGCDKDFCDRF